MGPTLQQQLANAQSAYLDAKRRKKRTREFHRRMTLLHARLMAAETRSKRKEAKK